jgi:hypothetical protein
LLCQPVATRFGFSGKKAMGNLNYLLSLMKMGFASRGSDAAIRPNGV